MRKLKNGFSRKVSIWVISIIRVLRPMIDKGGTQAIPSANALNAKSGIRTTLVPNARAKGRVYGVGWITFTKSALISKAKTEEMQNVQIAMKHIPHGQKTVRPS